MLAPRSGITNRNLPPATVLESIVRKFTPLLAALVSVCAVPATAAASSGAWSFWSAPTLHPPRIHADSHAAGAKLAPGYFMLANTKDLAIKERMAGQGGPLILDSNLQPVWFDPVPLKLSGQGTSLLGANATFNLRAQKYRGQPVLTWWEGTVGSTGATLAGQDMMVDQHYQPVGKPLVAQGPTGCTGTGCWVVSQHEFLIQGHDAWVTAYRNIPMDLRKYGGPANGTLLDTAVQEYDLTSGQQLFNWDALDHIPLSQSHSKPLTSGVWDAYHENSVNLSNGTFVVSMRNMWSAYDVSEATGKIVWTLSGDPKLSSFKVPASGQFQWQHDVELHPGGLVTVFDDHCCNVVGAGKLAPPSGPASHGLLLKLNLAKHTAALVARYIRNNNSYTPFLGNTQLISGGDVVVGWGNVPNFTEFTKSGKVLLDAVIPNPDMSYRTYLENWVGLPAKPPNGAVRKSGGKIIVYASWNGATRVVAWRVLAGASASHLTVAVSRAARTGFETAIPVSGSHKFFKLQAFASRGRLIGTSAAFSPAGPTLVGSY